MDGAVLLSFLLASLAIVSSPGPSVLFTISRAIVGGRRYGLLTVLGNAAGLFGQVIIVSVGVGIIVTRSPELITFLRLLGAGYLIWLGSVAIRQRDAAAQALAGPAAGNSTAPLREGFLVGLSNPKSMVFLAVLLPQYVEPGAGGAGLQMALLGAVFCAVAIVGDSAWALGAARARRWLSARPWRLSAAVTAGGMTMIGLGLLLLLPAVA